MAQSTKSKVIAVRSAKVFNGPGELQAEAIDDLLQTGLQLFGGARDAAAALAAYVRPGQTVGMKVNCLAKRVAVTQPLLVEALVGRLQQAGVAGKDITVWERSTDELQRAGYSTNMFKSGPRCLGTDAAGIGYSEKLYPIGSSGSLLSNILLGVEVNINLPVLKDHSLAGLAGGMKNYYGAIHNPNKYHDNHCDPHVAAVNALPEIRERNKLTIMDCLIVQYHGGPAYNPGFVEEYGGLILGSDPVAVDFVALSVLEKIRAAHGKKPLAREGRHPAWLATAAGDKYALGHASWEKIELIEHTI
jgi:uncharacterized protein (DUF362 family)